MKNHWPQANSKVSKATAIRFRFNAKSIHNKTFKIMKKIIQLSLMIGKYYLYGFLVQLFL